MDVVSEIKSKLEIIDVVRDYVPSLKKTGRYYKALSPFQKEKTPSFVVNPERGLAYCFSTNRGGDIFKFIQEVEGVDFPEALKILAEKAGIKLENSHFQGSGAISNKSELYSVYEAATKIYSNYLWSDEGDIALDYLHKRGLKDETIKSFKLGYSPEKNILFSKLKDKFDIDFLKNKSGLFNVSDKGEMYDKFRSRIMFPISNSQGLNIAFTARTISNADPKYVNSPDLPIFNKSNILYGYKNARNDIRAKNSIIVVEGQMDVLMSHQAGAKNVVATSGTAFTAGHVRLIQRLTSNIFFALDQDSAGVQAAYKAVGLCLQNNMNIKMVSMDTKDPGELIEEDSSKWIKAIDESKYFIDYFIELYNLNIDPNDNRLKKDFIKQMFEMISNCESEIELSTLFKKMSVGLRISEDLIRVDYFQSLKKNNAVVKDVSKAEPVSWSDTDAISKLRMFIKKFPKTNEYSKKYLKDLTTIGVIDVYNSDDDVYNSQGDNEINKNNSTDQEKKDLIGLEMLFENYYHDMNEKDLCKEFETLLVEAKKTYKTKRTPELSLEISIAEEKGDMEKVKELHIELMNITNFNG